MVIKLRILGIVLATIFCPLIVHAGNGYVFFPYLVQQAGTWSSSVTISSDESIVPDNASCQLTLKDSFGEICTWNKTDMKNDQVWNFQLDDVLDNFSGTPAPGNCTLTVESNYSIDGYFVITNGIFSDGTPARMIKPMNSKSISFPYVFKSGEPWSTGISICRTDEVAIANPTLTFTLRDSAGNIATASTDQAFEIYSNSIDMLTWSNSINSGVCSLKIEANCNIDGYMFHSNGSTGYGSLARLSGVADMTGDMNIGLQDAILILQIISGLR